MLRFACVFLMVFLGGKTLHAQAGCGVARDLVVQSIENLKGGSAPTDLEDGIQLLKQAVLGCATLGDAWYYRSLFEDRLGHKRPAAFALEQAKINGSEAMTGGISPFTLAAAAETKVDAGKVAQKWALVIGISKFKNGIDNLKYPKKDAEDFAEFLKDPKRGRFPEDHVKTLTNDKAGLVDIKAQLNWLARSAGPSDLVLVFIASHGTARSKDTVGQLNYILTHDSQITSDDLLYASSLPMIDVSDIIRSRVRAQRTVVILDTCHSEGSVDGLLRPAHASPAMLDGMKAGFGRAIIASSKQNQSSYESNDLENGIFTHFLIEALSQKGGEISLAQAFEYITQHVEKQAKLEHHDQTPVMVRSEGTTEIVIGVEPEKTLAWLPRLILRPAQFRFGLQ